MIDSPFSLDGKLAATVKRLTVTTDSNVFPRETNKVTPISRIRREKMWIVCDGQGKMNARYIGDPTKMIEKLAKLRDKDLITEEDFQRGKDALLGQLGSE